MSRRSASPGSPANSSSKNVSSPSPNDFGPQVRHVVAALAERVAGVSHRREHERQLVGVVRFPVGEAVRLDQQHLVGVGERVEIGVELVS